MWYILPEMNRNTNKQKLIVVAPRQARDFAKQGKVIVVVGPTASGKSDLGIKIARKYNGEIISADSRQVYRGMDVGTGKVTKKEQKTVKHHLLDVADPKKQFTVSDFKRLGEKAIKDIAAGGKVPIVVGGTGFYIDILLGRMAVAQVPPNKKLRAQFDKLTAEELFEKLRKLDPQRAKMIDRHNKRRLVRALEIVLTTKKSSLSTLHKIPDAKYNILWLGLKPKNIEKKIGVRLEQRLKQGMVKEVRELLRRGVGHKKLQNFGLEYKWLSFYIQGKLPYQEMKENLSRDIVKYSKRQMTWFKRNKEIRWTTNKKAAYQLAATFLGKDKNP